MGKVLEDCTACGGTGMVETPAWREWQRRYSAEVYELRTIARGRDLTREERLRLSEAEKARPDGQPEEKQCSTCKGNGRVPTPLGQEILELVQGFTQVDVRESSYYGRVVPK